MRLRKYFNKIFAIRKKIRPTKYKGYTVSNSYLVQNLVQVIDDLVTENAELQQQLTRKDTELIGAVETVRRKQQQMRQLVHIHVYTL